MDFKYDLHVPFAKLKAKGVKPSAMVLYGIILYHCYYQDKTYITNASLAKEFGCSDRQVQNYIKELKDCNCITIENVKEENGSMVRYITPLVLSSIKYGGSSKKVEKTSTGLRKEGFDEL